MTPKITMLSIGRRSDARPRQLAWLALLAAAAPLIWVASDWMVTGNPLWSLTNTQHTAETLHRETGIAKVPEYIPRRIGEILGPFALAVAALGGVLALLWQRARALPGALACVAAVVVFAVFASVGLPIDTRYAFLAAAPLCVFCGAAVCGWAELPRGDPHRRWWMLAAAVSVVALLASIPSQYRTDRHQLDELSAQQRIQNELLSLVRAGAITTKLRADRRDLTTRRSHCWRCGWKHRRASSPISRCRTIAQGTFVGPADEEVRRTLHPRPQRPAPAGGGARRFYADPRQPLVADLPALPPLGR